MPDPAQDATQEQKPADSATAEQTQQAFKITPEIQAMINDAAKKAHDAAFAEARRTFDGKAKKDQQPKPTQTYPDPMEVLRLRDALDDATEDMQIGAKQKKLLRETVLATRPEDVASFVKDFADRAGWSSQQQQTQQQEQMKTQAAPQPAAGKPMSDQGSTSQTQPEQRPADVTKWSQEDIARYYAGKNGLVRRGENGEYDFSDPRNIKIHRELRDMARARLANVKINIGDPNRR